MANVTAMMADRQRDMAGYTFVTETSPNEVPTVVRVKSLEPEPGKPCNASASF